MNLATHPLLGLYRERRTLTATLRRATSATARSKAQRLLHALEAAEREALADLRRLCATYEIPQERIARRLHIHRTMVSKVWNGGRPGRQREWVRSRRVIEATLRELHAQGWRPSETATAPPPAGPEGPAALAGGSA